MVKYYQHTFIGLSETRASRTIKSAEQAIKK